MNVRTSGFFETVNSKAKNVTRPTVPVIRDARTFTEDQGASTPPHESPRMTAVDPPALRTAPLRIAIE